jgi:hypothetical protein
MTLHWLTSRGESRTASPLTEFHDPHGFRYYVAFDPDFQRYRIYQHLAYADDDSPNVEVSPLD